MDSASVAAVPAVEHRVAFHGSGGEYFGIWIVNLVLTILTLGIYSAWAKVRRLKYFYGQTELAGARFDYHGSPRAILVGRLIGLLLFAAYTVATELVSWWTPVVLVLLAVVLPWLLRNGPANLAGVGWGRGIVLALFAGPLFMLTSVGGYSFAPLAHGAVLQPATLTVAGTILAAIVLKERPTMARAVGIAIIIVGLVAIAGPSLFTMDPMTPAGDAMFMSAGLLWALFTIATKRWSIPPVAATAAMSVLSAAVVIPAYLAFQGFDRFSGMPASMIITQLVVQGLLAGVLAIVAFAKAVQLLGGAKAAVFPAMVPAVAIIVGVPMTGEIPTVPQLVGLVLVSIGSLLAIGLLRTPRPRPAPICNESAGD